MVDKINEEDALRFLEEKDKEFGVNNVEDETEVSVEPVKSLGTAQFYNAPELSKASESPWKSLNLLNIPSQGLFYPDGAEVLLKSAKTKEIRHWSTIDETDPISVREKINFILNSLTNVSLKTPGSVYLDLLEIDKFHILFRIHELTFPNQENKLWANLKCTNTACNHVNKVHVTSSNLTGFVLPEELQKWYSAEERCLVIDSPKLGETLKFYLPSIGMQNRFRAKQKTDRENNQLADDFFYEMGPYLFKDWKSLSNEEISRLKIESQDWSVQKTTVVYKIVKMLKENSVNKVGFACEKCKTVGESSIFLGGSFTVKDIFIISAGLDELI
jgi:hypothetical protein